MEYYRAILAVLSDLLRFFLKRESATQKSATSMTAATIAVVHTPHEAKLVATTVPVLPPAVDTEITLLPTAWVCVARAPVYSRSVAALDTVLAQLTYATTVSPLRHEGRFTQVRYNSLYGWISKDHLVFEREAIFPKLVPEVVYDAHHTVTQLIRTYIDDAFAASELLLPLLPMEYVMYCLQQSGRMIPWGTERPRLAGDWHRLLRGAPGIQIGIAARTGAIYEARSDKGGYLAMVEAVHPDGTIVIAGVGRAVEGVFSRETYTKQQYRAEQGLFIVIA